ncbi:transcriptional regulator, LacI family [Actinobacteria bacterium OK074]|nr:transcriptional regulator, LacI family [Actinobacteria bacterium OK074]
MVTTKDLAERLQLSVSTVGRALADDRRISEQTKVRVREAAAEMGYVGNLAARMMRGASSNVVGLVIPDIRNSFFVTIAHELSSVMVAQGYQLMLAETNDDRTTELRQLRELAASRVAGIVIVPTSRPHGDSVKLLQGIPHVQLLRKHPSLGTQWFGLDDRQALREATGHLVERGHTRIAYVGGPAERSTGAQRLEGYHQSLRDAGLPQRADWVELGPPSSVEHGRDALRRLLELPQAPTAVVLGAVQHTVGAVDELFRGGVKVPQELSVVGFGDETGFSWWGPGLTTIHLPIREIAASCGLWFVRRLSSRPGDDDGAFASVSPGSVVFRGSTAPPGRSRPAR